MVESGEPERGERGACERGKGRVVCVREGGGVHFLADLSFDANGTPLIPEAIAKSIPRAWLAGIFGFRSFCVMAEGIEVPRT